MSVCVLVCLHACVFTDACLHACVFVYIPCTLVVYVKRMCLQLTTRKHVLNSKCALNTERTLHVHESKTPRKLCA